MSCLWKKQASESPIGNIFWVTFLYTANPRHLFQQLLLPNWFRLCVIYAEHREESDRLLALTAISQRNILQNPDDKRKVVDPANVWVRVWSFSIHVLSVFSVLSSSFFIAFAMEPSLTRSIIFSILELPFYVDIALSFRKVDKHNPTFKSIDHFIWTWTGIFHSIWRQNNGCFSNSGSIHRCLFLSRCSRPTPRGLSNLCGVKLFFINPQHFNVWTISGTDQ